MFTDQEYKILRIGTTSLIKIGHEIGPFLPWHFSENGYHWLIAECLLRRTTRSAAEKAYNQLLNDYPSWESLAEASIEDIKKRIAWIGLGQQRSTQLKNLSETMVLEYNSEIPNKRKQLLSLIGIGDYIADAILLYVHKKKYFPIDPNIQRVIRRILGRPTSIGTRHSTPYSDAVLKRFSVYVLRKYQVEDIVNLHRGMLLVSWEVCRPKPNCDKCNLNSICIFYHNINPLNK